MEKKERNQKIVQMRKSGMSIKQIASVYGLDKSTVKDICQRYGVGGQMCKQYNQYTNGKFDREANAIRYINERAPSFEYVGNYTGVNGYADIRCKQCGTVIRKSFVAIRQGTATCDVCKAQEIEANRKAKKEKADALRREREWQRERNKWRHLHCEQTSIQFCDWCGAMFIPSGSRSVYCSNECATKSKNTRGRDRRIKKLKDAVIDNDITLGKLYQRDGGKCYLCGQVCDWNDYTIREDGTFIANNNYPSIDHVKPLSKGGKHAWANVRLACRGCNSKKSDMMSAPGVHMSV